MTSCARYDDFELAERYVLGQLNEAEQADFEAHYFECPECFAAVQAFQAAQGELRKQPPAVAASASHKLWWIGLAAAASLTGLLVWAPWRHSQPTVAPPTPTVAQHTPSTAPPPTPTPSPTHPGVNLDALALVTPPPYVPLSTRGESAQNPTLAAFAAAMKPYSAKDYRAAAAALEPIVKAHPDANYAQFFLGISYLLSDDGDKAVAVLDRVAASGAAPFADEAHFYLAKAALRARDLDRAERELTLAKQREAGPPEEAQKLLQALRTYRREHSQP
jgi:TolA-binding protein